YCDIGAEYVDQTCSDCQVGFYKETQGKSSCAKCPAHYITLVTGATSGDDCNI
ncbi:CAunnamed protein product, partial [Biomphalaria glabrata]